MTNLVRSMMILLSVLVFSCSDGEDGAIGPAGQDGINGVDGQDGTNGEDGSEGATGTANVIYSDWMARDFLFQFATTENFQGLEEFDSSEFNENTDFVFVYGRRVTGSDTEIYQLPYVGNVPSQDYYEFGLFNTAEGLILQLRARTLDASLSDFDYFNDFRYMIIPGGVAKSAKDYTSMSYKEIVTMFNIPE
ncbi:collagen-like protein [Aquimarina sediminis]|uniref:collagen-like protein n=1 Tax=Aquimarina sediminis TaxID=2070536 RepID=UPI000FFE5BFE|nr:collagen-like protein [Aquimarina sediminis]